MRLLKKYFILILLAMTGYSGFSQQVIWEKKFGWIASPDEITSVCEADSGNYFGLGFSDKPMNGGTFVIGYHFNYITLVKFNQDGDTLFTRNLNLFCATWGTPYIGPFWNGQYVAVVNVEMPDGTSTSQIKRFPAVLLLNAQGEVMNAKYFPQHEYCIVNGVAKTSDNGLILTGYHFGSLVSIDSMFAMKVNFLLEQEWGGKYGNIANGSYRGEHLEPMANGNYLVSGTLGKRIYGMELDSNGIMVNEKIYHSNPTNRVFNASQVRQDWQKGTVSFGYFQDGSSNFWGYFGRYDSLGNKFWGGETQGKSVIDIIMNRENSFLIGRNGGGINITRITRDSVILWNWSLGGNGQPYRIMHGMCFTQPDTGIAFGFYYQQTGNLSNQFWLAKIAGVGTPYNPANPEDTVTVSAQEKLFRPKDSPIPYPNPTTETIRFTKLTQEAVVAIYSANGEKLMEKWIKPEEVLDVCTLPVGAYLYHLKMGERVFTGKFLKK